MHFKKEWEALGNALPEQVILLKMKSGDSVKVDLSKMDLEQLQALQREREQDSSKMKRQIMHNVGADHGWIERIERARDIAIQHIDQIQAEVNKRKKEERNELVEQQHRNFLRNQKKARHQKLSSENWAFKRIAKQRLAPNLFEQIEEEAKRFLALRELEEERARQADKERKSKESKPKKENTASPHNRPSSPPLDG